MNSRTHLVPFYTISAALHIAAGLVWANLLASENYVDLNINDSDRSLQITLLDNSPKVESIKAPASKKQTQPAAKVPIVHTAADRNSHQQAHNNIIATQNKLADTHLAVTQPELHYATDTVVTNQATAIQQSPAEPLAPAVTTTQQSGDQDDNSHSASAAQGLQDQNVLIQKKLRAHLNQHFYYPRIAVQKGWQGTVELGLRVEASGKLTQLRILKTSGYSILDQAALATLQKADYIKEIETLLTGSYFDTTLPVMYQLIGG